MQREFDVQSTTGQSRVSLTYRFVQCCRDRLMGEGEELKLCSLIFEKIMKQQTMLQKAQELSVAIVRLAHSHMNARRTRKVRLVPAAPSPSQANPQTVGPNSVGL